MVILLIIGLFFSLSLRTNGFAQIATRKQIHRTEAKLLAQSGIARMEFFLNGGDNHDLNYTTDRLEENYETMGTSLLSCQPFGFYARITSTGIRVTKTFTIKRLTGRNLPPCLQPALTLTGHIGGLILDKGSSITGEVVLHHGTIKKSTNGVLEELHQFQACA